MVRILMPPGKRPLHPQSIWNHTVSQSGVQCGCGHATDLFGSRGAKNDGVFSADEYFVLYAHAKAVEVFRELRIGRDVHT